MKELAMRYLLLNASIFLFLAPAAATAQVYGDPNSLVEYWYNKYLGRQPDPGMATWVNSLIQGTPPDQVLTGILASDEYYQRAGGTPQGFIARLYSDVLNQAPSAAELDFWVRRMYTEDRPTLIMEFLHQNPGVWVSSSPAVSSPVLVNPGVIGVAPLWRREWHRDWDHRHNIYEYRRPYFPYHHGDDHHDHHH
jgi:hypothetical protein